MSDEAKRLGSTTRFSATDAAEGLKFLARAGFDAQEATRALAGTLNLAQASGIDLGRAADIASNVLTGFRLEVVEIERVVDVLAKTTNSANTDMTQLGDAMKFVAPVAAGLGISLEETAAAVGALSDAGLQGTLAGTGLRRVLAELEAPSNKTEGHLKALGVTLEEVKPSTVGLVAALQRLKDAGVDTGQAMQLFGQRGGPAFEVMSNGIPKITAMTAELKNAEGTAN
jgi:TP901 family phage tail tape measure protein